MTETELKGLMILYGMKCAGDDTEAFKVFLKELHPDLDVSAILQGLESLLNGYLALRGKGQSHDSL